MVKRKFVTLHFLLVFSLFFNSCAYGISFSGAGKFFVNSGKKLLSLPKIAASNISKLSQLSLFKKFRKPQKKVGIFKKIGSKINNFHKETEAFKRKWMRAYLRGDMRAAKKYLSIFMARNILAECSVVVAINGIIGLIMVSALGINEYLLYKRLRRDLRSPNLTDDRKLNRACLANFRKAGLTKEVLEGLDDINKHFNGFYINNNRTSLHYISDLRMLTVVKWMVEEKFANVMAVNGNGNTARVALPGWLLIYNRIRQYLQNKENEHQDLVARVNLLKNDLLDDNDRPKIVRQEIIDGVPQRFQEIRALIGNPGIPGYAKQLVLPKLVTLHNAHNNLFAEDDIRALFDHVAFNYSFLNDQQFKPAVEFALDKNLQDIDGKTILEAAAVHGDDVIATIFETRGQFYNREGLFDDWLAERPDATVPRGWRGWIGNAFYATKGFFANLKNKFFGRRRPNLHNREEDRPYNAEQDFANALDYAKKKKNKKKFRDLANAAIVMDDLKQDIEIESESGSYVVNLPNELAAKIIKYAGADFGDKINFE